MSVHVNYLIILGVQTLSMIVSTQMDGWPLLKTHYSKTPNLRTKRLTQTVNHYLDLSKVSLHLAEILFQLNVQTS